MARGRLLIGSLVVFAVIVWWVLVLAFGNLLYTACLVRLEQRFELNDAKVGAVIAQYLGPLVATGFLAALAFFVGSRYAHSIPGSVGRPPSPSLPTASPVLPRQPLSSDFTGQSSESKLRITVGDQGSFLGGKSDGLYALNRTLKLRIENIDPTEVVTNIRVMILSIDREYSGHGPWELSCGITLAAGDHVFVPLAAYRQATGSTGYSSTIFERSATFYEILTISNRPKPSRDDASIIAIRATGVGSGPRDYKCRVWVDRDTGDLRISGYESGYSLIPLPEAMKRLHEATLNSGVAELAHGFGSDAVNVLDHYAYCAAELGLPIYGCRPASSVRELIPRADQRRGTIEGGASRLVPEIGMRSPRYSDLAVKQDDLGDRWQELIDGIKAYDQ